MLPDSESSGRQRFGTGDSCDFHEDSPDAVLGVSIHYPQRQYFHAAIINFVLQALASYGHKKIIRKCIYCRILLRERFFLFSEMQL
jgi:hypothetical protein